MLGALLVLSASIHRHAEALSSPVVSMTSGESDGTSRFDDGRASAIALSSIADSRFRSGHLIGSKCSSLCGRANLAGKTLYLDNLANDVYLFH